MTIKFAPRPMRLWLAVTTVTLASLTFPSPARAVAVAVAVAAANSHPTQQDIIFYNARLALRDGRPNETLKLWLLHNTLANVSGHPGGSEAAFRTALWVALGELGLCPDGVARDQDDAGLWPVALHNWVVRNAFRPSPAPDARPFEAFAIGVQQRHVSLQDVLSAYELKTVTFRRTSCILPSALLLRASRVGWPDLSDRREAAVLMRYLLKQARTSIDPSMVRGARAIEARIFGINLYLADLAARRARSTAREQASEASTRGVSKIAVNTLSASAPTFAMDAKSEEAQILLASLTWTPSEWLLLSRERRMYLFSLASQFARDRVDSEIDTEVETQINALVFGIIDTLIARQEGAEVEQWLALLNAKADLKRRHAVYSEERGLRLLSLGRQTGFRERAVIALHRGIDFLQSGELAEALRSLGFALRYASESRDDASLTGLARRWLAYVVGQYETDDTLVAMLREIVPRQDFNAIVEDLVWRAALRADSASFATCTAQRSGRTGLDTRIDRLAPLAHGDLGTFLTRLRDEVSTQPYAALRFVRLLVSRLETESADVRKTHTRTLSGLHAILQTELTTRQAGGRAQARSMEELAARCTAILDGLASIAEGSPASGLIAHDLSPTRDVFAGSVRLAPSDSVPWPFPAVSVPSVSVFTAIALRPTEWYDAAGALTFGWTVSE